MAVVLLSGASYWTIQQLSVRPLPPPDAPGQSEPPLPLSVVPLKLRLPWEQIVSEVERAIPKCAGSYPVCEGSATDNFIFQHEDAWDVVANLPAIGDLGVKGSVWRWEPVSVSIDDSKVSASVKLLYHIKAGPTGVGALVSCGYDEDARELTIGAEGLISFNKDWFLESQAKPIIAAHNLCEVTILDISVTGRIEEFLAKAVTGFLEKASKSIADKTKAFRPQIAAAWEKLQLPIDIGSGAFLSVNPELAYLSKPHIVDNNLEISVALEARPEISVGGKGSPEVKPLPDLIEGSPAEGFQIFLKAGVDYSEAERLLAQEVVGKSFALGETWPRSWISTTVEAIRVRNSGDKVVVSADLSGLLSGTIYAWGTPKFFSEGESAGWLVVEDLDYTPETSNALIKFGDALFYKQILARLQEAARWDLSDKLTKLAADLNSHLNFDLTPNVKISGQISEFGPGGIWVDDRKINAYYRVTGTLEANVSLP